MIKAGVGHSTHFELEAAAKEASSRALHQLGLSRADLLVCFATTDFAFHYKRLREALEQHTGATNIVGCSAMAVITGDGEFEGKPGLALLAIASDELKPVPIIVREGSFAVKGIVEAVKEDVGDGRLMLLLTDIFGVRAHALLEAVQKAIGHVPTIGAAASGYPDDKRTVQWANQEETEQGVSGLLLSGPIVHCSRSSQGCEQIGEPYVITRAEGNVIKEIGNRPAYQMLQQALSTFPPTEVDRVSKGVFAGILYDERKYPPGRGDYLMRSIQSIDPREGTLTLLQDVREGQTIQFQVKNPATAVEELRTAVREISWETLRHTPVFALYFESVGRGSRLHQEPDHDVKIIKEGLGEIPLIGFLSNAEFSPREGRNLMHTYSSVLTVVCRRGGRQRQQTPSREA